MNSTLHSSNTTSSSFTYGNKIPWTVAYSVQFFFAIIGNSLILLIVNKDKRLKTTTNYLVANMAASDFLVSLAVFPISIHKVNFADVAKVDHNSGEALCKFYYFIAEVGFTVSVYSCVFIAIDRYYAVAQPMKKPLQEKIKCIIISIWISSVLLHLPVLYFNSLIKTKTNVKKCYVSSELLPAYLIYDYFIVSIASFLPALVISVSYILTVCKLYQHKVPGQQSDVNIRRRQEQNRKVLKMSVSIVVFLYVVQIGWFIFSILHLEGMLKHLSPSVFLDLQNAFYFLLFTSLVYNFFIYLLFNEMYRENIKGIVLKCCFCCRRTSRQIDNHNNIDAVTGVIMTAVCKSSEKL